MELPLADCRLLNQSSRPLDRTRTLDALAVNVAPFLHVKCRSGSRRVPGHLQDDPRTAPGAMKGPVGAPGSSRQARGNLALRFPVFQRAGAYELSNVSARRIV